MVFELETLGNSKFKVIEFMERINIRVAIFCKEVGLVYELLNVWFGDEGMRGEKIDRVNKFLSNRDRISFTITWVPFRKRCLDENLKYGNLK